MSLSRTLAKRFSNYDSQGSVGSRLRKKRVGPLLEMIDSVFEEKGSVRIVDLGGAENYWDILSEQYLSSHNVEITIVNLPGTSMPDDHGSFRFVAADACNLAEMEDESFHIAHSNSVVEHVGDWMRMVAFANELSRVSKRYFVQTPNFWFPVEPHCMTPFFHWLPKPMRLWLVSKFRLGHWKKASSVDESVRIVERARLLNKKMLQALFEDGTILTERFWGLPKSFVVIKR